MRKRILIQRSVLAKIAFFSAYTIFLSGIVAIIGAARVAADATIDGVEILCQLTGDHVESTYPLCDGKTSGQGIWVNKTDMGSMFHNDSTNETYIVFGDTSGRDAKPSSDRYGLRNRPRPHVVATIVDFDHNAGTMTLGGSNSWYGTGAGKNGLIYLAKDEITAIPTSGWSYEGKNYLWMVHIKKWDGFATESTQSVVWQFNESFELLQPTGYVFPPKSKFALGTMVQAETNGTEYLYVFGTEMYRIGPVWLARTALEDLDENDPELATWVYASQDPLNPHWERYDYDRADQIDATAAWPVIYQENYSGIGELSVIQNPNGSFMMLYLQITYEGGGGGYTGKIMFRTAPDPWGPWSLPQVAVDCTTTYCYGSYMHPNYVVNTGNNRQSVYFVSSSMYEPGTSHLWDCRNHPPSEDNPAVEGNDDHDCNWVYNTFLVRMNLVWH